jgi:hypothetical protein
MARILAEEVNRPREVRAYGLTPGIGLRTKISVKSKSVNGWRHTMASRLFWLSW